MEVKRNNYMEVKRNNYMEVKRNNWSLWNSNALKC